MKFHISTKKILLITTIVIFLLLSSIIYFLSDLNKASQYIKTIIKNQIACEIFFGELKWERYGWRFGVSASELTFIDKNGNLIIQTGPTKIIWRLRDILIGRIDHFQEIETENAYVDIQRNKDGKINLLEIFPENSKKQLNNKPEIYNLIIKDSIININDELNTKQKTVSLKDIDLLWKKDRLTKIRKVELNTHVDSTESSQKLKVKGFYTDNNKFKWKNEIVDLYISAKNIKLEGWEAYLTNIPQLESIAGIFSGTIFLKKTKKESNINVKAKTNLSNFYAVIKNDYSKEIFRLPITKSSLSGHINKNQISIDKYESMIFDLSYLVSGTIKDWSSTLPKVDINLKTNKFNFKDIKENLPLSLLPGSTREKIEPIKDDGYITLDINAKGPSLAPKYYGTILLDDFNLTPESGFLNFIHGLNAKLTLNDEILNIDYLNIPIEDSKVVITGKVNNASLTTDVNVKADKIDIATLQGFVSDADKNIALLLSDIQSFGKFSLDLNITSEINKTPSLTGMINFQDSGFNLLTNPPFNLTNVEGILDLNENNVVFEKLNGLINTKEFYVDGSLSLNEDENINIQVQAKHLDVLSSIVGYLNKYTPINPIVESIMGEFSDLDIKATGKLSAPSLSGMVNVNNIGFNLPKEQINVSNVTGKIELDEKAIHLNNLHVVLNGKTGIETNAHINNYFSTTPEVIGFIEGNIDLDSLKIAIDPEDFIGFQSVGTFPAKANLRYLHPHISSDFEVLFPPELNFAIKPIISKPKKATYQITGKTDYNLETDAIKINKFNLHTKQLSIDLLGEIKDFTKKDQDLNLEFFTTPPTKINMLLRPLNPFKNDIKFIGDVDLMGKIYGMSSSPTVNAVANFTMLSSATYDTPDDIIHADNGLVDVFYMGDKGELTIKANNIYFESFNAMTLTFHAKYNAPIVDIDSFHLDVDPGYLNSTATINLMDNSIMVLSKGKNIELSKLGEFLFLNPKTLTGNTNYDLDLITKGLTHKEILANANGSFIFNVNNGNIGEIKLLHKGLQAASIIKGGLFGLNLRNFFNLAFTSKDGSFEIIKGTLKAENGLLNVQGFRYRAKNLFLNMFGEVNLKEMIANLDLFGYLPDKKETLTIGGQEFIIEDMNQDASAIAPELLKKRFVIPFISTTPPKHFKIEIKGDITEQNKMSNRALRSFKWVNGKKLEKEYDHFPKPATKFTN